MSKPEKPIKKEELLQLYEKEHRTVSELSVLFDCNVSTLRRHLARNNIRIRSQSEEMSGRKLTPEHKEKIIKNLKIASGKDNPNWKGGKSWKGRSKETGYVLLRVGNRYVPEHRYVIEKELGEPLSPYWHVHHLDGDKHNNHIDNLLVVNRKIHAQIHMTDEHKRYLSIKSAEARARKFWSTKKKN